jgi:hypothetical protein
MPAFVYPLDVTDVEGAGAAADLIVHAAVPDVVIASARISVGTDGA